MLNALPHLPSFEYYKPSSLAEAFKFLDEHAQESKLINGGTDLIVRLRDRAHSPKYIVDIKSIPETQVISYDEKLGLIIGAAVPMNKVIKHPIVQERYKVLADACESVASYQLRNRATIVGNICNASPAGDTIGAGLVMEGTLRIASYEGERLEKLVNFFEGPGKTTLKTNEIVLSLNLPPVPIPNYGCYLKLGRNKLSDLSIVGVTAFGYSDKATKSGFRIKLALASVSATPLLPPVVETILREKKITTESLKEAAIAAMEACSPIDDVRGSARYRKEMVRNMSFKALNNIWVILEENIVKGRTK